MTGSSRTHPDPDRNHPDEPLDDLDTEVVEDLDVGEEADAVRGGYHTEECVGTCGHQVQ